MTTEDDDDQSTNEPAWDDDDASSLVGKYVLVGVTYLASDGNTVTSQVQCHGRVTKAEQFEGVTIACEETWAGKSFSLPPDLTVFRLAPPGDYKLRSTGEVVTNPDMVATVTAAAKPS